jgi:hypothetical protein
MGNFLQLWGRYVWGRRAEFNGGSGRSKKARRMAYPSAPQGRRDNGHAGFSAENMIA